MDMFRKYLKEEIIKNGSKFFTVEFTKKDGTERTITGQRYESPDHQGANPAAHKENILTVIEGKDPVTGALRYKNINIETIKRLTLGGKTYNIK